MTAVLLALASSIGYGSADFVGGLASREAHVLRVVAIASPAAFVLSVLLLPFMPAEWSVAAIAWGAASGLGSAAAYALVYRSLALGPMSAVAPLTALISAVIPVGIGIAGGEHLGPVTAAGLAMSLVAIPLVGRGQGGTGRSGSGSSGAEPSGTGPSGAARGRTMRSRAAGSDTGSGGREPGDTGGPSGTALVLAVLAGTAIAAQLVCLREAPSTSGVAPLVAGGLVSAIALVLAFARIRRRVIRGRAPVGMAVASGLLSAMSNLAFLLAVREGDLAVVAVITALYPGATVVLARIVLRERVGRPQAAGLATAALAVALLAVS